MEGEPTLDRFEDFLPWYKHCILRPFFCTFLCLLPRYMQLSMISYLLNSRLPEQTG